MCDIFITQTEGKVNSLSFELIASSGKRSSKSVIDKPVQEGKKVIFTTGPLHGPYFVNWIAIFETTATFTIGWVQVVSRRKKVHLKKQLFFDFY